MRKRSVDTATATRLVFIIFLTAIGMALAGMLFFSDRSALPVLGDPGHVAGPFSFTNQDGKLITADSVKGKVTVVEYFFTSCPAICPKMNENLKTVYQDLRKESAFVILSHTSDPERDSVPVLKAYANRMDASAPGWEFLTGGKEALYASASRDYLLSAVDTGTSAFVHTEYVALLDQQRRVRGFYDMTQKGSSQKIEKDILSLINP